MMNPAINPAYGLTLAIEPVACDTSIPSQLRAPADNVMAIANPSM